MPGREFCHEIPFKGGDRSGGSVFIGTCDQQSWGGGQFEVGVRGDHAFTGSGPRFVDVVPEASCVSDDGGSVDGAERDDLAFRFASFDADPEMSCNAFGGISMGFGGVVVAEDPVITGGEEAVDWFRVGDVDIVRDGSSGDGAGGKLVWEDELAVVGERGDDGTLPVFRDEGIGGTLLGGVDAERLVG